MKKLRVYKPQIKLPSYRQVSMHPLWNLGLLTVGSAFVAFGVQGIAAHQGFLTGGIMGVSLLIWYATGFLNAPLLNLLLNIPLLIFSWFNISKRFVLYSIYGTFVVFVWGMIMDKVHVPLEDPLYAAITAGALVGVGGGIMLRSLGSAGGIDLFAVYLNQKWSIAIGRFSFMFNTVLFLLSITTIALDMVIVSFIMVFISSSTTDYVLRAFNQRKTVFIVTSKGQELCNAIIGKAGGRATLLPAYGGYTHEAKEIVMTVTTNFTLRSLEDLVFAVDPQALFAVENTFYVAGAQYGRAEK